MIYEYAVEPEMLLDAECAEFLCSSFGIPRGRLVSEFPEDWYSRVFAAVDDVPPIAGKRIEEALNKLAARMMPRKHGWDDRDARCWLEKAEDEHGVRPFRAILATTNPRVSRSVLQREQLHESTGLWNVDTQQSVARTADAMAKSAKALLDCAREVYFVDPYFGAEEPRFRRPFEGFLEVLANRTNRLPLAGVELHVEARASADFVKLQCEGRFRDSVPRGLKVRVMRWKEHKEFHNRYILTDRGGMYFGIGLDEGEGTDDVSLLSDASYRQRREQFQRSTSSFDFVDQFEVVGRK